MPRLCALLLASLAVLLAAAVPGAALAATAPPVAETQPATDVGQTQATLTASVNPQGAATTVHFELGTTTSYGLQSDEQSVPAGTDPVTVKIPVQGLTANTTYHVRVVATNDGGTATGADVSFTTDRVPASPAVSTSAATGIDLSSATLAGTVTPRGAATSWHFEYGRTTRYGQTTPGVPIDDGWAAEPVSVRIGGLEAGKTYHFRLVATNAHGTARSGDRSFVVASTPTAATLDASQDRIPYGGTVTLTGRLSGSKTRGVAVRLQLTAFPFNLPFADVATTKSSSSGTYRFTLRALKQTTRAVVIAPGLPDVLSPIVAVRVAVRTGLTTVQRRLGSRLTVRGRVTPYTPNGTVSLQRTTADGRWVPVTRKRLRRDGTYVITVRRPRFNTSLRVVGVPHDGGGHVSSASRAVRVAGTLGPA